jgi:hypothetical protein
LSRRSSRASVAAAALVDGEGAQRQPLDGLDDEVDQIILRDPIAQVRRQQQGGLAVDVDEAGGALRSRRAVRQPKAIPSPANDVPGWMPGSFDCAPPI